MLKNTVQIDHVIGNNTYTFICGNTAPLTEIKDALCQFMKFVGNAEDQAKAQLEQQAATQAEEQKEQEPDIKPAIEKAE